MNKIEPYIFDGKWIDELEKEDIIQIRKNISKLEDEIKSDFMNCLICNKKVDSFCNSHSIPQFVLENISSNFWDGQSYLLGQIAKPSGLKKTLTFYNICRECDSKAFKNYENPEKLNGVISNELMQEIAKKNLLHGIYIKNQKISLCKKLIDDSIQKFKNLEVNYNNLNTMKSLLESIVINNDEMKANMMDLDEMKADFDSNLSYKIIFSKKLDYMTEIACQSSINLVSDLSGKIINNVYDKDPNNRMESLHVCIFPFDGITQVLLFTDTRNKKYDRFKTQLNNHNNWKSIINYMILLYCDGWAISSDFKGKNSGETISKLREVIATSQNLVSNTKNVDELIKAACKKFKLIPNKSIYNFLEHEI